MHTYWIDLRRGVVWLLLIAAFLLTLFLQDRTYQQTIDVLKQQIVRQELEALGWQQELTAMSQLMRQQGYMLPPMVARSTPP